MGPKYAYKTQTQALQRSQYQWKNELPRSKMQRINPCQLIAGLSAFGGLKPYKKQSNLWK